MEAAAAPLLSVRNIRTRLSSPGGPIWPVDGVSFDLGEGKALAIVGESGSGKTLTALTVVRLQPSTRETEVSGEIFFAGQNLLEFDDRAMCGIRGRRISMVFQDPMSSLNPVVTVGDQIAEVLRIHGRAGRKEARRRAVATLQAVGMPAPEQRAGDYPHELSGGMCQRAMIAMALACDPQLLIADEPTTALDVTTQAQTLALIRELRVRRGMALILITHNLGIVAEMVDDVAVMYAGRVVEHAPVVAVLKTPRHPYTVGLLGSMPRLGAQSSRLMAIEGVVPMPREMPKGCRFHPRCSRADERCRADDPGLREVTGGHRVACWKPVDLPGSRSPP